MQILHLPEVPRFGRKKNHSSGDDDDDVDDGRDGTGAMAPSLTFLLERCRSQYHHPSPLTCHLALLLVQCLFAGMHVTASPALKHIPPVSFCALRLILALPFLGWLAGKEGGRRGGTEGGSRVVRGRARSSPLHSLAASENTQ